ncbi:MAG TPA: hypothetical protein VF789_06705 [Thermoanaerobaculia bacterium]
MAVPARPLSEITEEGIRLLVREMGAADAARFISQFTTGFGDYTKERKELFKGLTIEDVVREVRGQRKEKT